MRKTLTEREKPTQFSGGSVTSLYEAIVLCGGYSLRLKPYTNIPKPLLKIKASLKLVDYQIRWLKKHGFKRIILATRKHPLTRHEVEYSIEKTKLGTGGALKKAVKACDGKYVYVMNVDDILIGNYNPAELISYADRGGAIVVAKPKLRFGKVKIKNGLITEFVQKPTLDFYVSTGHYTFKTETIKKYFPKKGDFERKTSPKLASLKMLRPYRFNGLWLTINTYKELLEARKTLKNTTPP